MRSFRLTSLLILLFLLASSVLPAHANTLTVNSLADTATAGDGACTLREAIAVANADTVGHADCGTGSGADTITLNVTGQINVNSLMSVSSGSTIIINEGAGDVILNGVNSRIFSVIGNLTINGLTLQNGVGPSGACISTNINVSLTINDSTLQNCQSGGFGGAVNTGTGANVTISNSTFANNSATVGGAIYMTGTLNISGSTFTANTTSGTTGSGGAIFLTASGNSSITNTLFDQNIGTGTSSMSYGGAIGAEIGSTTLSISGSTFSNNRSNGGGRAGLGGAIGTRFGTLTISDSVFTGNQALGTDAQGGAIYTSFTGINVTDSRLQSNTATGAGGAFYANGSGTSAITGSCIVNNSDLAVVDNFSSATNATGNWWGSSWGPRFSDLGTTSGSYYSTGDSINGNGTASVNVGLTSAGDGDTAPTGNWLTSAPTVAGASCETHPSATTSAGLNVTVPFQGRPTAPNARLIVPLTVILKPTAGGAAVINTTLSTDQNGVLPTLTAPAGSYTLWVKGAHTLARSQTVTLAVGSNPLTLSMLLEGDANNDNQVALSDFSLLASAYGTTVGDPNYNASADFNGDDTITLPDFSLLSSNYATSGAAAP